MRTPRMRKAMESWVAEQKRRDYERHPCVLIQQDGTTRTLPSTR